MSKKSDNKIRIHPAWQSNYLKSLVLQKNCFTPSPFVESEIEDGVISVKELSDAITSSFRLASDPLESTGGFSLNDSTYWWKVWAIRRSNNPFKRLFTLPDPSDFVAPTEVKDGEKYDTRIVVQRSEETHLWPI